MSLIDLPPTLLDTAGLPVPEIMQGHSWLPLKRGEATERPEDAFIQISEAEVGRAIRTKRWKYGVTAPSLSGGDVPAGEAYVERYLYDLEADPYELENLAGRPEYREVADGLRRRLAERMEMAGEGAAVITGGL